jgi:hypothetical protein
MSEEEGWAWRREKKALASIREAMNEGHVDVTTPASKSYKH